MSRVVWPHGISHPAVLIALQFGERVKGVRVALTRLQELAKVRGTIPIPSRLIRRLLFSALATAALAVLAEDVESAQCDVGVRAPTAEEQKFYADAFAQFQKTAPPAPAGWTTRDEPSTGVRKEVCAAPGQPYFLSSFMRNYNRGARRFAHA